MPTLGVSQDIYERLKRYCKSRGIKLKHAVDEALREWLEKVEKHGEEEEG